MPAPAIAVQIGRVLVTAAFLLLSFRGSDAADGSALAASPEPALQWVDVKLPGLPPGARMAMIEGSLAAPGRIVFRLSLPPGFVFPPHFHDTDETLTVIDGAVFMSAHGGSAARMEVGPASRHGTVHDIPAKTVHWAVTRDEPATLMVVTSGPYAIHWAEAQ